MTPQTKAIRSLISSWHWNREDFDQQWRFLSNQQNPDNKQGETIWKTRFKDVQLIQLPEELGGYRIALKTYAEKRFFRYLLRPSLACREAEGFRVIESLGIPVAQVLAFGEKRNISHLQEAYFITRFEEGTETLLCFQEHPEEQANLMQLLVENIRYLAQMHAAGYVHGGAHPRNFLWKKDANGVLQSIWIDLASVRRTPGGKRYWKYILTDLSDFAEGFKLGQENLDLLMAEYRKIHNIPTAFRLRHDHSYKFAEAYRCDTVQ